MLVKPEVVEQQENQMTVLVILNVVFAVFVVLAMLSLLGGAIIADRRPKARLGLPEWSTRSGSQPRSGARQSPAPAAVQGERIKLVHGS
jgi:hypothetical protein